MAPVPNHKAHKKKIGSELRWTIRDIFIHINSFTKDKQNSGFLYCEVSYMKYTCRFYTEVCQIKVITDTSPSGIYTHLFDQFSCVKPLIWNVPLFAIKSYRYIYIYENVTYGPSHWTLPSSYTCMHCLYKVPHILIHNHPRKPRWHNTLPNTIYSTIFPEYRTFFRLKICQIDAEKTAIKATPVVNLFLLFSLVHSEKKGTETVPLGYYCYN